MNRLKRCIIYLAAIVTMSCLIAGCNTMEGAGQDIEQGGEAIQDAAD